MKSKTKTHAIVFSFQTTEYEIGCWGGGQRRLIATFGYDCGSGGGDGGRQQQGLATAGDGARGGQRTQWWQGGGDYGNRN